MAKKSKSKRKLSPAQKAGLKKGQETLAAMRAAGKTTKKKRAGTKRAKKIVKKVAAQAKASKKEIARDAKKASRVKRPFPLTSSEVKAAAAAATTAAQAAKHVADVCATKLTLQAKRISKNLKSECTRELNKIKRTAEQSFKLAGFGEALGTLSKKEKKARKKAARKAAAAAAPKKAKKAKKARAAAPAAPSRRPTRVKRGPAAPSAPRMGRTRAPMMSESLTAEQVLRGVRTKVGRKMMDFWVCAGPQRTGCGNTGHVVAGGRMFPAVRFRPGPKQIFMTP